MLGTGDQTLIAVLIRKAGKSDDPTFLHIRSFDNPLMRGCGRTFAARAGSEGAKPLERLIIFGLPINSFALDREQKVRLMAYARGWSHAHREGRQHKGPITRAFLEVLQTLLWGFLNTKTGACFPSYEAIGKRAGCHPDTALEAVKVLERAGILTVFRRLTRLRGGAPIRTSNGYVFRIIGHPEIPRGSPEAKESSLSYCATRSNMPTRERSRVADLGEIPIHGDLLAARRKAVDAMLLRTRGRAADRTG